MLFELIFYFCYVVDFRHQFILQCGILVIGITGMLLYNALMARLHFPIGCT